MVALWFPFPDVPTATHDALEGQETSPQLPFRLELPVDGQAFHCRPFQVAVKSL